MQEKGFKTKDEEKPINEPILLADGIFMYQNPLKLNQQRLSKIAKNGYVLEVGGNCFILQVDASGH